MELNLIHLQFTNWGMDLTTYMGDIYLPWRTIILGALLTTALVIRKRMRSVY